MHLLSIHRALLAGALLTSAACSSDAASHAGAALIDGDAGPPGPDAGAPLGEAQIGVGRPHNPAWVEMLGGDGEDEAWALAVSPDGIFIAGQTSSDWGGSFTDDCVLEGGHAGEDCGDAFVYDVTHDVALQFGEPQTDIVRGIVVDSGFVYLAGKSREDACGNFQNDGWAAAYPTDLSHREWRVVMDTFHAVDEMLALSLYGSQIYLAGGSAGPLEGTPTAGVEDAFVMSVGTDGVVDVVDQFGSSEFEEMMGIDADAAGVVATGQTGGGAGNLGSTDVLLIARDLALVPETCRIQFGTSRKDVGQSVAVTADAIYVAGWTDGRINGAACNQGDGDPDAMRADVFVSRYDRSCAHVWTRQFGTAGGDIAEAVATDGQNVFVVGEYGGGEDHSSVSVPTKAFLRAYTNAGALVGEILFDAGENVPVTARAVAVDSTHVYVAGGAGRSLSAVPDTDDDLDAYLASVPRSHLHDGTSAVGDGCPP